jgi:hypothetical protein
MSLSFPFQFVNRGEPVPFNIQANPDFPTETQPVCILTNLGVPASPDTFITIGSGVGPNAPDDWELTFHWETTGGPAAGTWEMDAFLESVGSTTQTAVAGTPEFASPGVANMTVPGFPQFLPGVVPQHYNQTFVVPSGAMNLPTGVHLFRLWATLRWNFGGPPVVRLAGRAEGPLIEFYLPV